MHNELEDEDDDIELSGGSEIKLFERLNLIVDKGQEPLRIDKFVLQRIEGATRNKIQNAIFNEQILVNEKPVKNNYLVKPGDKIIVFETKDPDVYDVVPENIPLDIVYEDEDVLVINKHAGMVVHPGSGNHNGTLLNGVLFHLNNNAQLTDKIPDRGGMLHRIDKNTSGLIVFGKSERAMVNLSKQFAAHTVHRRYIALVWGNIENDEGTIVGNVGRHQQFRKLFTVYPDGEYGKHAVTHYKVLERFNYVTLVECRLETGRTHQIRVHMKYIGHTLFADDFYGGDKILKGTVYTKYKQFVDNCFALCQRQALHAAELGFVHPNGKKMEWKIPLPNDMEAVIEKWRKYSAPKNYED